MKISIKQISLWLIEIEINFNYVAESDMITFSTGPVESRLLSNSLINILKDYNENTIFNG